MRTRGRRKCAFVSARRRCGFVRVWWRYFLALKNRLQARQHFAHHVAFQLLHESTTLSQQVYGARLNNSQMFGALIVTVGLGVVVFAFFGWLGHLCIGKWHESTRQSA